MPTTGMKAAVLLRDRGVGEDERMASRRTVDRMLRRSRDLLALALEQTASDPLEVVAGVICDGCGKRVLVRAQSRTALEEALPMALAGWSISETARDGDRCPRCVRTWAA